MDSAATPRGARAGARRLAVAVALLALGAPLAAGQGRGEAAFPGESGPVAFTSLRDGGDSDIFVMGADGSAPTNLTGDSAAFDGQPAFSPDGTQIAFASDRGGDPDVFVMGADGSAPTNLTSDSAAPDLRPTFSPDGTRIAFDSSRDGGDFDVFAIGADGSGPTNLTGDSAASDGEPAFSPDGTRIAFRSNRDGGDLDVFVMGADGSAPSNLTGDSAASDGEPAFSPDGTRIAFTSRRDGGDLDVFVMGADGSGPTNLTGDSAANDFEPAFSPDGTQIAFTSLRDGGDSDVFVMGADGSGPTNLTGDSAAFDGEPDWQRLKANRALTLDASKRKVKRGKRVLLSGQVVAPHNEAGCEASQIVELQRRKRSQSDAEFKAFDQLQTDAAGSFADKVKVKKSFLYRAQVAETEVCEDGISNTEKVKAKKRKKRSVGPAS
ncbi:MAG TPA: hypothetical protein VEK39_02015 [Solirubrobacterales bacterium]|nr:hypothetical protein [Solirubrobacterales bacterium]